MASVLTIASTVLCDRAAPGAHGGKVGVTPRAPAKLTVDGNPVLVQTGIVGKPVTGCATQSTSSSKPCTSVVSLQATGFAQKLTLGGQPVALDSLAGTTDGAPPGAVPADARQTILTTV
jgi:hypothetical protein